MKIIKRKSDNIVIFAGNEISLNDELIVDEKVITKQGARGIDCNGKRFNYPDASFSNCDILEIAVSLPEDFVGGHYSYDAGEFALVQAGIEYRASKLAEEEEAALAEQKQIAISELDANDRVFIRHGKRGVGFNQEWRTYDDELRKFYKSETAIYPTKPTTFPDGSPVQ